MTTLRALLYLTIVVCFASVGLLDLLGGSPKLGLVALLFALANGLIFFWRP